jgi:hypothetical protein
MSSGKRDAFGASLHINHQLPATISYQRVLPVLGAICYLQAAQQFRDIEDAKDLASVR